jgi:hypothetical protein
VNIHAAFTILKKGRIRGSAKPFEPAGGTILFASAASRARPESSRAAVPRALQI